MSLTIAVPVVVPSLFHSSLPCVPSVCTKNSVLPTTVTCSGTHPGTASLFTSSISVAESIRRSSSRSSLGRNPCRLLAISRVLSGCFIHARSKICVRRPAAGRRSEGRRRPIGRAQFTAVFSGKQRKKGGSVLIAPYLCSAIIDGMKRPQFSLQLLLLVVALLALLAGAARGIVNGTL